MSSQSKPGVVPFFEDGTKTSTTPVEAEVALPEKSKTKRKVQTKPLVKLSRDLENARASLKVLQERETRLVKTLSECRDEIKAFQATVQQAQKALQDATK